MAKDVDLSSKQWTDIIFEGKNKEFGAYKLRQKSDKRHNLALLWTIVGLAIVLLGGWGYSIYSAMKEQERAEAELERLKLLEQQALAELEAQQEEDTTPENILEPEIPEAPEALAEEILNTEQFTEFQIVTDDQATEVKTNEEMTQTTTAIGSVDFDQGTDNLEVVREYKNEVIVEEKHETPPPVIEENKVFTSVEQMPSYPGGEAELMKYLSSHIKYPQMAAENGVQGRVVVQFVVTKTGAIGEVKVVRGKDPDLDKEAVRVVKTLPKFNPGKMNGQPVNVWFTLPVQFKLQNM